MVCCPLVGYSVNLYGNHCCHSVYSLETLKGGTTMKKIIALTCLMILFMVASASAVETTEYCGKPEPCPGETITITLENGKQYVFCDCDYRYLPPEKGHFVRIICGNGEEGYIFPLANVHSIKFVPFVKQTK